MARVLGRIRLSRLTDESTSAGRQRELIEQWSAMNDHTVVGWAEDLDISGSVDPFDTPQLGDWLNNRAPEFDIIACWKLDRLSRNTININGLFGWCIKHGKTVVSVTESIDLGTPVGRLIANVLAFLAEGELEAIRERTKAGRQKVVSLGRWPGGPAPFGFTAVKLDGGGFKLAPRADQVAVIKRISDLILSGLSMEAVAKRLNDDGVPSPTGKAWRSARLFLIMESKLLLGHSTYKGQTVRDAQGMPVMVSEPILEPDEWDRLQAAIQARRLPSAVKRTQNTSPLYGVLFCKSCGSMMYNRKYGHRESDRGYTYDYYMCPKSCGRMIHAELIYKLLQKVFLSEVGDEKVRERVYVPAESHETELKEAQRAVDEITPLLGAITSETMKKQLTTQLLALDSRIKALESKPVRESHFEYQATGGTYAQAWESSDLAGRRDLLVKSGITASAFKPKTGAGLEFELVIPPDIREQMGLGPRQSTRVTVTDVLATMQESGIAGIEIEPGKYVDTFTVHPIGGDDPVEVHALTDEGEAQAAEFYGWEV
jgi:DNA invertase Pin-like site-specific DNA recombinase